MRILIACEYSGTVRDAFSDKGWEAWSCDILPTEKPGNHIQGDVLDVINDGWDMMIAHPPCTYLAYSGMNNWYDEGRALKRAQAAVFFMQLYDAPINHICVENPQCVMTHILRKPDQTVHPYYWAAKYNLPECRQMKRTCLWLKNLPNLSYKKIPKVKAVQSEIFNETNTAMEKPEPIQVQTRKKDGRIMNRYFTDSISKNGLKSGKEKSKSFQSIAMAMADQWTEYYLSKK